MSAPFRHEIPVRLELESPFATRGAFAGRLGLDTPLARTRGKVMLPGTLLLGVIRAALDTLRQRMTGPDRPMEDELRCLFGEKSSESDEASADGWRKSNDPRPGLLTAGDLVTDAPENGLGELTRVAIDDEAGAASEGFLQVVELPFAIGRKVAFGGALHLRAGGVAPDRARFLVERALALVPALGAIKSAGFGRLHAPTLSPPASIPPAAAGTLPGLRVAVEFTLDRPFLVAAEQVGGNLFRGDDLIPGAVLKGALATALGDGGRLDPAMSDLLARITVGHASPLPKDGGVPRRPVPLCLAVAKDDVKAHVYDRLLARDDEIALLGGKPARLAFAPDWKDEEALVNRFLRQGWDGPRREVRTRTKIDSQRGVAEDGLLFSYAAVEPWDHRWRAVLTAPDNADAALFAEILAFLQAGLGGIGKTDAVMHEVTIKPEAAPTLAPVRQGDARYALVLQAPALLSDLDALRRETSAANDYAAWFAKLGFRLHRHFARQRLVGGHQALRYPPRDDRYEMYLLTEPGSVFLVEPEGGQPEDLATLLARGLPPRVEARLLDWRRCPFQRENGFGAVACHVVEPSAAAPDGVRVPQ